MPSMERPCRMKHWRPDGWENDFGEGFPENEAFERGADAMLEGLKQVGIQIDEMQNPVTATMGNLVDFLDTCKNGWLVFIPE